MRRIAFLLPFLLFPAAALADATASSGSSLSNGALLLLATAVLGLAHAFQGAITSAANALIAKGKAKVSTEIASSTFAKDHPNPTAAVQLLLGDFSASLTSFFDDSVAALTSGSVPNAATLATIKADATKDFLSRADLQGFAQALSIATGGVIAASSAEEFLDNHADKVLSDLSKGTAKTVITTADGTRIVAPAANPQPGAAPLAKQAGQARGSVALTFALLALVLAPFACTASQGAAAKADAVEYGAQVENCLTAEVQAAVPAVLSSGAVAVTTTGIAINSQSLEAQTKADAIVVAWCAADAAGADIKAALASPGDGGKSVAVDDVSVALAKLKAIRIFQVSHPLSAVAKDAGH